MSEKPKIFKVTQSPKGLDEVLSVKPDMAAQFYCAVVNVSDSPCATFDYQLKVPSFWFPIHEHAEWGYVAFFGTLKVVNNYYKGDKPVLIHCHAGANRSPSVAYAILRAKGYTKQEAEDSLNYPDLSLVFQRNIDLEHVPQDVIEFLKYANEHEGKLESLHYLLAKWNDEYRTWAEHRMDKIKDATVENVRIIYHPDKKRFARDNG
jgi:hypothetical protein